MTPPSDIAREAVRKALSTCFAGNALDRYVEKFTPYVAELFHSAIDKAVAAEREACAKIADRLSDPMRVVEFCPSVSQPITFAYAFKVFAEAIRSRQQ